MVGVKGQPRRRRPLRGCEGPLIIRALVHSARLVHARWHRRTLASLTRKPTREPILLSRSEFPSVVANRRHGRHHQSRRHSQAWRRWLEQALETSPLKKALLPTPASGVEAYGGSSPLSGSSSAWPLLQQQRCLTLQARRAQERVSDQTILTVPSPPAPCVSWLGPSFSSVRPHLSTVCLSSTL